MTATTALTAQNTTGVAAIHPIPPAFVAAQIAAVFDDMSPVDVVKTGMLAGAETVRAVARALKQQVQVQVVPPPPGARSSNVTVVVPAPAPAPLRIVVDPVMLATTGAELLPSDGVRALREDLLPLATVLTPNVPEARMLLGEEEAVAGEVRGVADLERLGRALVALGPEWVLVKGGHVPFGRDYVVPRTEGEKAVVVDVLVGKGGECVRMEAPWVDTTSTHGTGCSLACELTLFPPCSLTCHGFDDRNGGLRWGLMEENRAQLQYQRT